MLVVELLKELMACPSITPDEAGSHGILVQRLERLGFIVEDLPFEEVDNFWARRGSQGPLIVFAGHSDVVPPGPDKSWTSGPFEPTERQGFLFGRGAVDMKGGLAASVIAVERFLAAHPDHQGSLAFLVTSDEEGASINGTKRVIEVLEQRNEKIDYCIIGEPSSEQNLGDQIRVGRRGSLHGKLIIQGKQGHIAYPVLGHNPIHNCLSALQKLIVADWERLCHSHEGGNLPNESREILAQATERDFPPTTFQISNIHAGTGALNVTPAEVELRFNFRFSNALTAKQLQEKLENILNGHQLQYSLDWDLSGEPFLTSQGKLLEAVKQAVHQATGAYPKLSTGGGTSDGRFIAPTGAEVIELGLIHTTAHQIDECVRLEDLHKLVEIYEKVLINLLTK